MVRKFANVKKVVTYPLMLIGRHRWFSQGRRVMTLRGYRNANGQIGSCDSVELPLSFLSDYMRIRGNRYTGGSSMHQYGKDI